MRERVIEGVLYREEVVPGAWTYSGWRGNGHHELTIRPATAWGEVGPADPTVGVLPPGSFVLDAEERALAIERAERDAKEVEERRRSYARGNGRRAQIACRRYIKAACFNEMLTLTYRTTSSEVARGMVPLLGVDSVLRRWPPTSRSTSPSTTTTCPTASRATATPRACPRVSRIASP